MNDWLAPVELLLVQAHRIDVPVLWILVDVVALGSIDKHDPFKHASPILGCLMTVYTIFGNEFWWK